MKKASLHILLIIFPIFCISSGKSAINRYSVVTRHNVIINRIDSLNCLSVGNGEFTFTVDVTGLQTFPESYARGIPLGTMSDWGWHTSENPDSFSLKDVYRSYNVHGRQVDYVHQFRSNEGQRKAAATEWLRANPHRIHLGMIGLSIVDKNGRETKASDIQDNAQTLNLWTGEIESRFSVEGVPVSVKTVCHPDQDMISSRIESGLIREKRLRVRISFPLGTPQQTGYDFNSPGRHFTERFTAGKKETLFKRRQESDIYYVKLSHPGGKVEEAGTHTYYIIPEDSSEVFEFSGLFSKLQPETGISDFKTTEKASKESWAKFSQNGIAIFFKK